MNKSHNKQTRSISAILLEFLGSMYLAVSLLVAVAIASVIGTVLLQNQAYTQYRIRFGDFWFDIFETIGLYDVYTSAWFLSILGFLVISTSVCIYRNAPQMLRDMKNYRLHAKEKSLRAFHHKAEVTSELSSDVLVSRLKFLLQQYAYKFRIKQSDGFILIASMKGIVNRLGYIFTHVSIVLICVGGLIDGNIGLKIKVKTGQITPIDNSQDMRVDKIPDVSRLKPGEALSFRGNRSIPEGSTINAVVLDYKNGYVLQELPFAIEVSDFRIEYYPTGQPKSFQSDLIIHDSTRDKPLKQTIAVNHPLIYKGYAIYQATFGDGGSLIDITAWPLTAISKPRKLKGEVFTTTPVKSGKERLKIEITDFRMFNIIPSLDKKSDRKFFNQGPSFLFKLRNAAGEANEYINYMQPIQRNGRWYFRSDVRQSLNDGFKTLWIPADRNNEVKRFMAFRQKLLDKNKLHDIILTVAAQTLENARVNKNELKKQLVKSMESIVADYNSGELNKILSVMARKYAATEFMKKRAAYLGVLQNILIEVYTEVLAEEGIDVSQGITDAFDQQFFNDAFIELGAVPAYASDYYFQLSSFRQIESTGLQITRAPGKPLVYLGCVMLILGVFIMFYVHQKRLWFYLDTSKEKTTIIMAATSNRQSLDFDLEYEKFQQQFLKLL